MQKKDISILKGECDFRYSLFDFRVHLIVDAERSGKLFGDSPGGLQDFFHKPV